MNTDPRHLHDCESNEGRARRARGFTLIEIMAVVLIIGLLSTLVGIAIFPQIDKARVNTARSQLKMLDAALETYRMDNAKFPTSEQGLVSLVRPPADARNAPPGGSYLREKRVPADPWGNPYQYEAPGQHNKHAYDLWSLGADGAPGGTGVDADIGNWASDDLDT
ncbi:MAG: type II secretion system major pseudopilin GspG [Myxococcota bacterium]